MGMTAPTPESLLEEIAWDKRPSGKTHLLCMGRAVFNQDIEILRAYGNFRYSVLKASLFEKGLAPYVKKEWQTQTFFHKKYNDIDRNTKIFIEQYINKFISYINNYRIIDGIVVANSDYWQDEPLKVVCKKKSLPFIVLSRENYIQKYERDFLINRVNKSGYKFTGDIMCVASQRCREVLLETGAYAAEQIAVTGWPRMDLYERPFDHLLPGKPLVTLIAYQDELYLAPKNFMDVLDTFIALARENSRHFRFVIKVKKISHARKLIRARPTLITAPVHIEWKALSHDVVRASRIVIGYNTTGVLEALLSEADIIVPWWLDAVQPEDNLLISAHSASNRKVFAFPHSRQEFINCVKAGLARHNPENSPQTRRRELERYIHMPREGACAAFERTISQILSKKAILTPKRHLP